MHALKHSRPGQAAPSVFTLLLRVIIMLLPAALLLVAVWRTMGQPQTLLVLGTAFQIIVCCLSFLSQRNWREPLGPAVITLYLIALGWLWLGAEHLDDWYPHFAQSILLIVPLTVFAVQTLMNSGAPALRRAQTLAHRLANRKDWPNDFSACRNLPEVKAFREALHLDASPALALLQHPRVAVRVAALAALEFRPNWRPGQAALVLQVAEKAAEPPVRAAAISALANVDDRPLVETIAEFLRDPSWEVRRAATEALFWDSERRWSWIRHAVRQNLADPAFQDDGPLECDGQLLPADAIEDLNAWAAEKGVLALRAAQTLGVHYKQALSEQQSDALMHALREKLADPHAPSALRIEIARLLQRLNKWDGNLLEKMLDLANPAPLRLMAAEALLQGGDHPRALAALYDIARLPNREIALATAEVAQRLLGVDLGLPIGQPVPAIHSRQAAEVTRRVMLWAAQQDANVPSPT
jgi:hypothetical protein